MRRETKLVMKHQQNTKEDSNTGMRAKVSIRHIENK